MRRYYKSTFWFMFFCTFSLIILSIIDGALFVFHPNNAFVIMFDKFLSISRPQAGGGSFPCDGSHACAVCDSNCGLCSIVLTP